jgi:hypothetical protein
MLQRGLVVVRGHEVLVGDATCRGVRIGLEHDRPVAHRARTITK